MNWFRETLTGRHYCCFPGSVFNNAHKSVITFFYTILPKRKNKLPKGSETDSILITCSFWKHYIAYNNEEFFKKCKKKKKISAYFGPVLAIFGIMEFFCKICCNKLFPILGRYYCAKFWKKNWCAVSEKSWLQTYVRTDLRTEKLEFIGPFRLVMGVQKGLHTFLHWVIWHYSLRRNMLKLESYSTTKQIRALATEIVAQSFL